MSGDSLERYGGVLAAPPRFRWRTVLGVVGAIHAVAATVLVAIVVTHHATTIRCRTLSPPAGSQLVQVVAFSPNGRTLATVGANGYTYLWDVATGRLTATLSDPVTGPSPMSATSATFGPDGTTLAIVDGNSADLWNVTTNHLIATLIIPGIDSADSVAFSPDGRMLAVGGKNGDTGLWDVADRHLIATLANPSGFSGESLVFAPNGQLLATEDDNLSAYVWNVRTRRLIATLAVPDGAGGVSRVKFSPDSRTLAVGDDSDHANLCPLD
jgi:eukaryotic-like serine/threonine-protein kinase